jgi:hypothetical protein
MQRPKSRRHVKAANARWRAAEARAQAERDAGIPDRDDVPDCRQPFTLDLRSAGGDCWHIEPRRGYVAWRAIDFAGQVKHCAALKTLLTRIAADLPRMMSARRCA